MNLGLPFAKLMHVWHNKERLPQLKCIWHFFLFESIVNEIDFISGFLLNKKPGVRQPKRVENAKILIANTPMDTDKIKVFGSRVRVESVAKVAELEVAEKEKMAEKVSRNCL